MSNSFENQAASKYADTPDFQRLTQLISTNIQKITSNVTQMQNLQAQITSKPKHLDLQDRFHRMQHQSHLLAKETGQSIKELNQHTPSNPSDQRLHKIRKERLLNDFTKVLNSFQNLQRKERIIEGKQAVIPGDQNPFEAPKEEHDTSETQQEQAVLQIDGTQADLDVMQDRENSVRQLESDIADVNNIFKDLALIVHEQGDTIDTIEANTETAAVNVEQGTDELRQASVYNIKARKKKLCLCGTLAIIIVIIIIVLAVVYG